MFRRRAIKRLSTKVVRVVGLLGVPLGLFFYFCIFGVGVAIGVALLVQF